MVGQTNLVKAPLAIFAKLKAPLHLADLPEVDVPTRYFFSYVGPEASGLTDVGVALAVAFTDKDFQVRH